MTKLPSPEAVRLWLSAEFWVACPACEGTGTMYYGTPEHIPQGFKVGGPCSECKDTPGKLWPFRKPCYVCQGTGRTTIKPEELGGKMPLPGCWHCRFNDILLGHGWLPDCDDWERLRDAAVARGWCFEIQTDSQGDWVWVWTADRLQQLTHNDPENRLRGYPAIQWALAQAGGMQRVEEE